MTLAEDVDKLEREYNNLKELCGEIIITFMLKENTRIFENLPPEWHELVDRWQRWYKDITSTDIQKHLKVVQLTVTTSPHLADWVIVSDATTKAVAQELERQRQNDNN